jgi:riboflavin synthase alpha subunit
MITVSLNFAGSRLHCVLNKGSVTAEGDSKTLFGALAKTYIRLVVKSFKTTTFKWRKIWTGR